MHYELKKSALLLTVLFYVVPLIARPRVPVILTAGQSNADGRVPLSELPLMMAAATSFRLLLFMMLVLVAATMLVLMEQMSPEGIEEQQG